LFFSAKAGDEGDEEEADDDTDPYELLDPVEILDKLPKNFYEQVIIIIDPIFSIKLNPNYAGRFSLIFFTQ
jgi:hypothetical protein